MLEQTIKRGTEIMREILFRGKRKDNGEWVYGGSLLQLTPGDSCYIAPSSGMVLTAEDDAGNIIRLASNIAVVIPETVGQFTGLTANGTKIFEGDIVADKWCKGIVTFGEGTYDSGIYRYLGWYVLEADGNRDRTALVDDNEEWAKFQVIGNIHDNPELMEV